MFDDPNLVSSAGLVPVLALAESAGLDSLDDQHLTVPTGKGANAGLKMTSLVAGMVAGADSIEDVALLRHGGEVRVFARAYAPSTLGSFLCAATIRRKLISVPARIATSARRITLHLPTAWPSQAARTRLVTSGCGPPTPTPT